MTKDEALDLALEALEDRSSLMKWQKAITAIKQALEQPTTEESSAVQEVRLWDTQWTNVVNHDNAYSGWDKQDAINHAVKMTEQYIAKNVSENKCPPAKHPVAPLNKTLAAINTLEALGYTYHGGEQWKPPLGTQPTTVESSEVQEPVANASEWFALVMGAAAELEDASTCLRDEDAKQVAIRGAKYYRQKANALYSAPPEQPAPMQEPVGRVCFEGDEVVWTDEPPESGTLLYTTPPAAQPAPASWTEMVTANLVREGVNKHKARELAEHFYSLAQRPFVGLTDEERDHIWHVIGNSDAHGDVDGLSGRDVMAAIEAKLRSKNNENTD